MKKLLVSKKIGNARNHSHSISAEIFRWIGIPIVVVMLLITVLILWQVRHTMVNLAKEKVTIETQSVATSADIFFHQFGLMSTSLAMNQQFVAMLENLEEGKSVKESPDFDSSMRTLVRVHKENKNIVAVWLADIKTNQLWASDGYISDDNWNIYTREWYKLIAEDTNVEFAISEPYYDETVSKNVVTLATAIKDAHGNWIGVAGVDVGMDDIYDTMKEKTLGKNGYYVLLTGSYAVGFHPDPQFSGIPLEQTPVNDEFKNIISGRQFGFVQFSDHTGKNVGYYSPVGDTNWTVISVLSTKEYSGGYNTLRNLLITIIALAIVTFTVLIIMSSRKIIKPLIALNGVAHQIAEGDLNVELNVETKNEIGLVASSIQRTVARLSEYIGYIQEVSQVLDQMAQGDMRVSLTKDYQGEFSLIKQSLEGISKSLNETLWSIHSTSQRVSRGSENVSSAASALAVGATQQASAIQELNASAHVIAEQSKENAKTAEEAKTLALEASAELQQGNEHMEHMLVAMREIESSSEEIHKIIKAIDDIAFQTNILALNAAVEAARAGEAGKGFAVVADEVRNLAARSAEAAKQTQTLVEQSVSSAHTGLKIARETADALERVKDKAMQSTHLIGVIAESSKEQSNTIDQINIGLGQISTVVQNNAATAEQSSASSEELSEEANRLYQEINKFRLDEMKAAENNYSSASSYHYEASNYSSPSSEYASKNDYTSYSNDFSSAYNKVEENIFENNFSDNKY